MFSAVKQLPATVLATLLFFTGATAQHDDWTVNLKKGGRYKDVSLVKLTGDSLLIRDEKNMYPVPVDLIASIERREGGAHTVGALLAGAALGAGLGFLIAQITDVNKQPSVIGYNAPSYNGNQQTDKGTYAILGGVAGGLVGVTVGAMTGKTSHDLGRMTLIEKKIALESMLVKEGMLVPPNPGQRDFVYLKNGSIIKGTVIETIPDSTVKIQTDEGRSYVYRMTEVDKITKEPDKGIQPVTSLAQVPGTSDSHRSDAPRPVFTLFVGLSSPVGEFGATDENGGGALPGLCFGGDLSLQMGSGIGWVSSVSFMFNSLDDKALALPDSFHASVDAGSWFLITPMTGIRFGGLVSPQVELFGLGQIGLVFGNSPETKVTVYTSTYQGTIIAGSASATAFAFGLGGGVILNKHLTASLRYMHSDPEYTISVGPLSAKGKQSTSVLQIVAGYTF